MTMKLIIILKDVILTEGNDCTQSAFYKLDCIYFLMAQKIEIVIVFEYTVNAFFY